MYDSSSIYFLHVTCLLRQETSAHLFQVPGSVALTHQSFGTRRFFFISVNLESRQAALQFEGYFEKLVCSAKKILPETAKLTNRKT